MADEGTCPHCGKPVPSTALQGLCPEIVLDVPEEAQEVAFGLLLTGKGQVWMDDLNFEVVGKDVPTTAESTVKKAPASPVNLNFED